MTTATAVKEEFDLETMHPVWSAKYQIETCGTELKKLAETEAALAEERMVILKERDVEAPAIRTRLEQLESEINRLQVRQDRESDKIKALTNELPELRQEAEAQLDKLAELKKRLPEVSSGIESIDSQLASVLSVELAQQLIDLVEERNRVVKEFKGIPWLIRDVRSYFHLEPGVQEVTVPELPIQIRNLVRALSK